jgi:hypothetical protein
MTMTLHDLDSNILDHINNKGKELEQKLDSDVVCYFGRIHPQYFRPFRNFIEQVVARSERKFSPGKRAISIVLKTPGGSVETAERIVTVVRKHFDIVNYVVPDLAMSAGTIICMSGDKIYMDYSSALGPIDPQVLTSDGSGYVAALGYLDKVAEITAKSQLAPADVVLLKSLDLAKLALYEQARDLSIDLIKDWLVEYKFKNWNKHRTTNPGTTVTQDQKEARAEEIARELASHKVWHSHGRSLDLRKLNRLKLEIDDYSDDADLTAAIRGYNDPLTSYTERLGMPFFLHHHSVELR